MRAFNPSTRSRGRWISEFEASLVYKVSSRTARATQRNPVLKNQKKKPKQNKKKTQNPTTTKNPKTKKQTNKKQTTKKRKEKRKKKEKGEGEDEGYFCGREQRAEVIPAGRHLLASW